MPRSKKRRSVRERQAKRAQAALQEVEAKKLTLSSARVGAFRLGLVVLAITFAVTHWLAHLGLLYEDRPVWTSRSAIRWRELPACGLRWCCRIEQRAPGDGRTTAQVLEESWHGASLRRRVPCAPAPGK